MLRAGGPDAGRRLPSKLSRRPDNGRRSGNGGLKNMLYEQVIIVPPPRTRGMISGASSASGGEDRNEP